MMRAWPLSRKIIGLGLLNILLAALVAFVFARIQYGVGFESLFIAPAQDRIMGIASKLRAEVEAAEDPDSVIAAYARQYHADVFVTNPDGQAIYGPTADVPPDVMARIRGGGPHRPPPRGEGGPPRFSEEPKAGPREPFFFVSSKSPPAYWAGFRTPIRGPEGTNGPGLVLFRTSSILNADLFTDWRHGLALAALLTGVTVLCWLPFLRGLTRSIARIDQVTERIAEGRFDVRAPDHREDELGHLGSQINRMAARLESFVKNQKRYLGDIAHELSAPIARVQFALAILERRAGAEHRVDIEVLHEEVQEMSALVNELLSFSKAGMDAGAVPLKPVDVAEAARTAAEREASGARLDIPPGLQAMAHPGYLVRAIGNLLRNAARYAGEFGPIVVSARGDGTHVLLTVADNGPGLPDDMLEQIFEPFYRPQASRSRDTGGVGLGLAIVKSCVEACRGTVACRNRKPSGLEVVITLAEAK
ncbi:MAG: HAMP domain-containing sensor histidine kinase [Bryobacteraceae bacterium]